MQTIILLMLAVLSAVQGYNILVIFGAPSRSHNNLGKGIVDALLAGGHKVSWATPYPFDNKNPNLKLIHVDTAPIVEGMDMMDSRIRNDMNFVKQFCRNVTITCVNTPALRDALINTQYDAVVTEWFFSDVEAGYAAVQKVPWILAGSIGYNMLMERLVDEVRTTTTVPLMFNNYPTPMNFWQRVVNFATCTMMQVGMWYESGDHATAYDKLYQPLADARGVKIPQFSEALNNVSILLLNTHQSYAPGVPLPPNAIPIGGYHIPEETPPLPKDLQDLLDSSKNGFVYFSMGSVLKSSGLPDHTRDAIIEFLGQLPYTVLWKFEEELSNLPTNVHIRAWMPQASILAHPNIKVFITHGGLLSSLEALKNGVPLLSIPVFGDQQSNAFRATQSGYGKMVPFDFNMAADLKLALNDLLSDDKYYKKAKYLSKLFNNREVTPRKLLTHYIEVAIETKGAYHLRSPSRLYAWYERWMLDFAAVVLIILYVLCKLVKRIFCSKKNCSKKDKVKKN